jgi:choline kinase
LPFGRGTILSNILSNLAIADINEFVFVLGFEANRIIDYLKNNKYFGFKSKIILNSEYKRGNGLSVLMAEQVVENHNFILSMSDHIVSSSAIKRVLKSDIDKNLLLVDKRIHRIFDIDDATKVNCNGNRIKNIGKSLTDYNGIDCGIFRLNSRFFNAMRTQDKLGRESISAGIEVLIENDDMEAIFMEENEHWIDIDTPEAYQHAKDLYT